MPRSRLLTTGAILAVIATGCSLAQARSEAPRNLMLADFEDEAVLKKILVTGVEMSLTDKDAVTGRRALQCRVRPFSEHGNHWPRIILGTDVFPDPIDASSYSKIVVTIRNVTEGLPPVKLSVTSLTYNDGGRNWDDMAWYIPEGESMRCEFPLAAIRYHKNDPSEIRMLMFVFVDHEIDSTYRIDSIQLVDDPAEGSPARTLLERTESVSKQLDATHSAVNWDAVPAAMRAEIRPKVPQFRKQIRKTLAAARSGVTAGLGGEYNEHTEIVEGIERQLGRLVLADKRDFYAWQNTRYLNVYRDERPDLANPPLESINVRMAMDEFRDSAFMVNSVGKDTRLEVAIRPSTGPDRRPLPADAVQIRHTMYFNFKAGQEELGDVLTVLDGPLEIPRDQSRQVWLTFDARLSGIEPGEYGFDLVLRDMDTGTSRTYPGSLTVWALGLPNYDVLANNGYVEFFNCELGAKVRPQGVAHMKRYGLNMVLVYWNYMPFPVEVDDDLNITTFDTSNLEHQVRPVLEAWKASPGNNQRLRWIFSFSYLPERLIANRSIKYPDPQWRKVFAQWLERLYAATAQWGVAKEDIALFLRDESNMSVLLNVELPWAELIKSVDPNAIIMCNRGPGIRDRDASFRFYKAFDSMLSRGDRDEQYPYLAEWIALGNTPPELWTYRANDRGDRVHNLYSYYRVYGWDNFNFGIIGPGVWTYCARAQSPWGDNKEMVGHCLAFKHRDKDEVVHSRRYEFYREGVDDYRYLYALRQLAESKGPSALSRAEQLIGQASDDIAADVTDTTRCDRWRVRIAREILRLKAAP
ncbi:MAG: hypothetical protein CMJ18_15755 [Phycisphaeraceae bacterium]|nr:hypothetical protein [Phycisphaeraceae bacterium]